VGSSSPRHTTDVRHPSAHDLRLPAHRPRKRQVVMMRTERSHGVTVGPGSAAEPHAIATPNRTRSVGCGARTHMLTITTTA
jgi:hypothetical protein